MIYLDLIIIKSRVGYLIMIDSIDCSVFVESETSRYVWAKLTKPVTKVV